jgi:hypothetical protein
MKIETLVISSWALMLTTFLAAGEIAIYMTEVLRKNLK